MDAEDSVDKITWMQFSCSYCCCYCEQPAPVWCIKCGECFM